MKQTVALVALRAPSQKAYAALALEAQKPNKTIVSSHFIEGGDDVFVLAGLASEENLRTLLEIDALNWRDDLERAQEKPATEVWLTNPQMEKPVLGRFGDYVLMQNRAASPADHEKRYKQWMVVRDFDVLPIPSGSLVMPDRWRYSVLIAHCVDHAPCLNQTISFCLDDLGVLPEEVELMSVFGEHYKLNHYKACLPHLR